MFFGKYIIIGLLIAAVAGGAILYFKHTQAKMLEQAQQIALQQVAIENAALVIEQQRVDMEKQANITANIQRKFAQSRNQVESLRSKFNKTSKLLGERDLGKLAIVKPKAITRIINNGTKQSLRCLEIASGSPLTSVEVAATKKSEINNACPDLANPNYIPH